MIAIVDYGVGNLFSLKSSLTEIGAEAEVVSDPAALRRAERIILPGVGAFGDAADKLRNAGLDAPVKEAANGGKPLLGICLGMQLLFDRGYEYGEHEGLGLLPGEIRAVSEMAPAGAKIPHIGWNSLHFVRKHPLFKYVREGDFVYFVHSYAAVGCGGSLVAVTDYGAPLTAAAAKGSVMGCQFHPEKSGEVGLSILRAFCEIREGEPC